MSFARFVERNNFLCRYLCCNNLRIAVFFYKDMSSLSLDKILILKINALVLSIFAAVGGWL